MPLIALFTRLSGFAGLIAPAATLFLSHQSTPMIASAIPPITSSSSRNGDIGSYLRDVGLSFGRRTGEPAPRHLARPVIIGGERKRPRAELREKLREILSRRIDGSRWIERVDLEL